MIRRFASLLLALLLGAVLVACSDDSAEPGDGDSAEAAGGLETVQIAGDVGADPEVTWDGELAADEIETEVVTEGEGDEIESGDQVFVQIWIGNGVTQEKAFSTYDGAEPQLLTVDEKSLSPMFLEGLEGRTIGSRVAIGASAEAAFGDAGNQQLKIGKDDTVLTIIDVIGGIEDGPEGEERQAPGWAPALEGDDEAPTGLDFTGTPKPTDQLRTGVLVEGDGPAVKKGQTIAADYLGQVYGGKKPFDESFAAQPVSFPIGVGQVVKGWDRALVGQTVGSRVILAIPPALGYGEKGNPGAGISGTDTLYFVVDILGAA